MRAVWASDAGWRRTRSVTPMPSRTSRVAAGRRGDHRHRVEPHVRAAPGPPRPGAPGPASRSRGGTSAAGGRPTRSRRSPAARGAGPPSTTASAGGRTAPIADSSRPGVAAMAANYSAGGGAPTAAGGPAGWSPPRSCDAAWAATGATTSQPSRAPPGEPGQVHDQRRPRTPASPRESIAWGVTAREPGPQRLGDAGHQALAGRASWPPACGRAGPRPVPPVVRMRSGASGGVAEGLASSAVRPSRVVGHHARGAPPRPPPASTASASAGPGAVLALARAPSGRTP